MAFVYSVGLVVEGDEHVVGLILNCLCLFACLLLLDVCLVFCVGVHHSVSISLCLFCCLIVCLFDCLIVSVFALFVCRHPC